ncbi:MAG: fatty-acyl-CoA synthase, partial [Acidimicrobiaceae bacterium]
TSGTTGSPKGVAVRHKAISQLPNALPTWTGAYWMYGNPLFTFAGVGPIYMGMKTGMTCLYHPRFDAEDWLATVERDRPLVCFIVPAMAQLLVAHPKFEVADLSSVAVCFLGSAPAASATIERLRQRMPNASITNAYGMSEAGGICSISGEELESHPGSVGCPKPPIELRIVGDDGRDLRAGEAGEIIFRQAGMEREYYRDAAATASTWSGGWLHTGDIGHLDADGYLYIVGRKKDVIIRGGHNVHAIDVEAVLYECPDVIEAAVVGVPHDVLGEDVVAFVVLHEDAKLDASQLRSFCAERLADYKVPRRVTLVDELPHNAGGKVLKHELAARAASA